MRKMAFNVKLYDRVVRRIKNHPRSFAMSVGINTGKKNRLVKEDGLTFRATECGTVSCFAGWTQILGKPGRLTKGKIKVLGRGAFILNIAPAAQEKLGITQAEATSLFYSFRWPEPFQTQFHAAKTKKAQVKVALAYFADFREKKLAQEQIWGCS